jgi:DNA-damage-inducible protein D
MGSELSKNHTTLFESIKELDENRNEYWGARKLSKVLEYSEFRHFSPVIERAKEACKNSGHEVADHFEDYLEEILHGKGAKQDYESIKLSRYACYLIVQNADPSKEVVAQGQTYFAIQTRLQEIRQMEEYNRLASEDEKRLFLREEMKRHNVQLADTAKGAGQKQGLEKEPKYTRSHGQYGVGCKLVPCYTNRRKTKERQY